MLKNFKQFNEDVAADVDNLTGIIDTKIDWYGEDDTDKSKQFEDFKKPVYSVRATYINLLSYFKKYNIVKIKEVIARWSQGKESSKMSEDELKSLNDYLNGIQQFTGLTSDIEIQFNSGEFVQKTENFLNLFKLVQGIIQFETGTIDKEDLGEEYSTVKDIVIGGFELKTNDEKSKPAYVKYNVDLESEEYKNAKASYLEGNKSEKEEKKSDSKETKEEKKASAFKKILKDFK